MKTWAVKTKQGWFLRDLPGFDDIREDSVQVEVALSSDEYEVRDYKELRGIAIMERFLEKEARSEPPLEGAEAGRTAFREKFGYEDINGMEDILRHLKGKPS
jgi:hypothetical protein